MAFDSKTNTIMLGQHPEFLADSGSLYLKMLSDDALQRGAPSIARDWKIVQRWLRSEGRELTQRDYERFGVAFRSYLARGIAPSVKLEPSFGKLSELAKSEARQNVPPVPPDLIPVFDRLMATDKEILAGRVRDSRQFTEAMNAIRTSRPAAPAVSLNWIPLVSSMVMLLLASADDWPDGFYQLLRIVVFGTALYVVALTANRRQYWPWLMGGIAILFNPILPIEFRQEEWQPIDFGVAIVFLVALIHMRPRKSGR